MTSSNLQDNEGEKFNVVQFFEDGSYEYVRRSVSARDAVAAMMHYKSSVAARAGMVTQVMITDMLDQTVFHWVYGKGIVFPTLAQNESIAAGELPVIDVKK